MKRLVWLSVAWTIGCSGPVEVGMVVGDAVVGDPGGQVDGRSVAADGANPEVGRPHPDGSPAPDGGAGDGSGDGYWPGDIRGADGSSESDGQGGLDAALTDAQAVDGGPTDAGGEAVTDWGTGETDAGAVQGSIGWPCEKEDDCLSGYCVEAADGYLCTQLCGEGCPEGWECAEVGPPFAAICLPIGGTLCRPCVADYDCWQGAIAGTALCLDHGDGLGSFCTIQCQLPASCPAGYQCQPWGEVSLCVAESCGCPEKYAGQVLDSLCHHENEHGICSGVRVCAEGELSSCDAPVPVAEQCDGEDQDCDGIADDGFPDSDGDGQADCVDPDGDGDGIPDLEDNCPLFANPAQNDQDKDGLGDPCDGDIDGDGWANGEDCAPANPKIHPGAKELCDGLDQDCDGLMDEGYPNADGDGAANCIDPDDDNDGWSDKEDNCPLVANLDQSDLDGDGIGDLCDGDADGDGVAGAADCAPLDPAIHPGASESCNGLDDDCDGELDEPGATGCAVWFADSDGDGHGALDSASCLCAPEWPFVAASGGDCDDSDIAAYTGAAEQCDGLDQDCDGKADNGFPDLDGDGLADCIDDDDDGDGEPDGSDCMPLDAAIHPGAAELCNGDDDDCDGVADGEDAVGCSPWFLDGDGDGWGVADQLKCLCGPQPPYVSEKGGDCDDQEPAVHPGAKELCNQLDDDCDPQSDCPAGQLCHADQCLPCLAECGQACLNDSYCLQGCCVPWGIGPQGLLNGSCVKFIEPGVFRPSLECDWVPGAQTPYPNHAQVLSTPLVHDYSWMLGSVNAPWVIFTSYNGTDGGFASASSNGLIRVIDGKSCALLHTLDMHEVVGSASPAIADLDLDNEGLPEIVAFAEGGGLVAFKFNVIDNKWVLLWHSTEKNGAQSYFASDEYRWNSPTIVNLDNEPHPEILAGGEVFTWQGVRLGTSLGWKKFSVHGQIAVAADVDLDGAPELVTGNGIYGWTGSDWKLESYFTKAAVDGLVAVADFGAFAVSGLPSGIPEVVVISTGQARIMKLDGTTVFGPYAVIGGGSGGPPTIGDFDSDGQPEFALASKGAYQVFDLECAKNPLPAKCAQAGVLWWKESQDYSSSVTGSSIFDFEGDGQAEAIYADECFVRVYDGKSGNVLFSRSRSSCTWYENPIVADTDNDFRAEIVVGSNTNCSIVCPTLDPVFKGLTCLSDGDCPGGPCQSGYCRCTSDAQCAIPLGGMACSALLPGTPGTAKVCRAKHQGTTAGVRIFRDYADSWVSSRKLWNQHAYYVTNIKDDGTVPPASQTPTNWTQPGLNNFRQNSQGTPFPLLAPDATAKPAEAICDGQGGVVLAIELCNRGAAPLAADTPVAFYDGPPGPGKLPICTATSAATIMPANCAAMQCTWKPAPVDGPHTVWAVADDGGAGVGDSKECDELNNPATLPGVWCP